MIEKLKKIINFGVLPLLLVLLAVWAFTGTAGSKSYDYQGYIIAVRDSEEGQVITTLCGDKEAEFTIKWHTRKKFSGEIDSLEEGAFIRLSTTRKDDTIVKKFSAYDGFYLEGKIVFMKDLSSPFILTQSSASKAYSLYSLISSQDYTYPLETGTQVKVYFQYPLYSGNPTIVIDAIEPVTDVLSELTEKELAFITMLRYEVADK